jgi:hypothetical protein
MPAAGESLMFVVNDRARMSAVRVVRIVKQP